MQHAVLVHYHEVGLKGRNRSLFERALVHNLTEALEGTGAGGVTAPFGRLVVRCPQPPGPQLLEAVGRTFGVAVYAPALEVEAEVGAMTEAALALLAQRRFETFAVSARRATKELPLTSREINVRLGAALQAATGARVDLSHPDVTVHVEVLGRRAWVYCERLRGPGGLPTGVSGRVMCLLSGGIDSPVATYRICRRGAKASLCHFHSYPFTDRASVRKVRELARIVASWQGDTVLYAVPFGEAQQEVVAATPPKLRVVLYRRLMVRIAAELARREGAGALVTGDSLGQVASQTLENLAAIEEASPLPILRPLVGDDKQDIVDEARRIGTYEVSILPYQDCCSLFVPRSPETRATVQACLDAEAALDVAHLVERCTKETEVERVPRPRGGV